MYLTGALLILQQLEPRIAAQALSLTAAPSPACAPNRCPSSERHAAAQLVAANKLQKGDVIPTAQLAGIMAAKQTASLIPLCHSLPLSQVRCELSGSGL